MSDTANEAKKPTEKKQALEGTRLNAFGMDPEALTLVTDPKHPLYDERINLPLNEDRVRNVMAFGVIEPVIVMKEGELVLIVDGRQRVRWVIEANKRLREQGLPTLKVPCILRRGSASDLFGVTLAANANRDNDSPLLEAKKAQRYIDTGHSEEEAALALGVSDQTIRLRLKLLEASPEVQGAVEEGKISIRKAIEVSKESPEEQKKVAAAPKKARARKSPRAAIKKQARELSNQSNLPVKVKAILSWLAGDIDNAAVSEVLGIGPASPKKAKKK